MTAILITGGSGFLGQGIVEAISQRHPSWQITILDIRPPPPHLRINFIHCDITSSDDVQKAFGTYKPDIVVHTAGIVPARQSRYSTDPRQWHHVKTINYDGTRNVVNAAIASGCHRFVYTSSCTVVVDDLQHDYFNMDETTPTGFATLHYGRSKTMAEQYVMSNGLIACALRPCTIIGPHDSSVISVLHDLIAKRETSFIIGDGYNLYDFMYIDNAVDAHLLAIENLLSTQTAAGQVFFISNQEPVYFWDLMAFVWAQFDHYPRFRLRIPLTLAWIIAYVLEWLTFLTGAESTLSRGSIQDIVYSRFSNNEKAITILGYKPTVPLSTGIRLTCEAYKKRLAGDIVR